MCLVKCALNESFEQESQLRSHQDAQEPVPGPRVQQRLLDPVVHLCPLSPGRVEGQPGRREFNFNCLSFSLKPPFRFGGGLVLFRLRHLFFFD